jgi:hypothetical protein
MVSCAVDWITAKGIQSAGGGLTWSYESSAANGLVARLGKRAEKPRLRESWAAEQRLAATWCNKDRLNPRMSTTSTVGSCAEQSIYAPGGTESHGRLATVVKLGFM